MANKKYKVVEGFGPLSLRKSPDPKSDLYEEWFAWADGEVFTPPPHMDMAKALDRGIVTEVKG